MYHGKTWVFKFIGFNLIVVLLLALAFTASASTTYISLGFSSLPSSQGWNYTTGSATSEVSLFSVNGTSLFQNTVGQGYYGFDYRKSNVVDPNAPFTVSVTVRITDYEVQSMNNPFGFSIGVSTGNELYDVGIAPGNIRSTGTGLEGHLFTTSVDVTQFHEYRIEATPGQNFELFIDNVSYGSAPPRVFPYPNAIIIGDTTAGANANAEVTAYSFVQHINEAPNCSSVIPNTDLLWPPEHQLIDISIIGVTDADGDPVSITIDSIYQDEPTNGTGDGDTSPDGFGIGSSVAQIRAERDGSSNGRMYHISYTANDGQGGSCSGVVLVGVNQSQGKKGAAVDEGSLYDSTLP